MVGFDKNKISINEAAEDIVPLAKISDENSLFIVAINLESVSRKMRIMRNLEGLYSHISDLKFAVLKCLEPKIGEFISLKMHILELLNIILVDIDIEVAILQDTQGVIRNVVAVVMGY